MDRSHFAGGDKEEAKTIDMLMDTPGTKAWRELYTYAADRDY